MKNLFFFAAVAGLFGGIFCGFGTAKGQPAAALDPLLAANPAQVEEFVMRAYTQGLHQVTIPPGTYRLACPPQRRQHLAFAKMHDFEIVATGVNFIFTDRKRAAISFEHCQNMTLRGATLLRETIPFSQGHVLAVGEDGMSIDVQVAKGYPTEFDDPTLYPDIFLNRYDAATRLWQQDIFSATGKTVQRLGPDSFRFFPSQRVQKNGPVAPGVPMVWRGVGFPDIALYECAGCKIIGVTVRGGTGFCVYEGGGAGGNYYSYDIAYGAKPPGADEEPYFASDADGFHSNGARKGPTLEDCHFEGMDDDGIAIHGSYAMVRASQGNTVVAAMPQGGWCQAGDTLRLIDERGVLATEAKVVAVKPRPDYHPTQKPPAEFLRWQDLAAHPYLEITLDKTTGAKFTWLLENASAEGNGFIARRCVIKNHRGRGFLIKTGDGLIEDCTTDQGAMGGIVVSPEMGFWNEAGYAQHLVIRNNVIRNVAYIGNPGFQQAGSLSISAFEHGHFVPLPGGQRDVTVEGNRFENDDGSNIVVSSAEGIVLRNNRFIHPMDHANERGHAAGVDSAALIWLTECSGVQVTGNTIEAPGPFMKAPLVATPTASGTGFQDGIKISTPAGQ